MFLSRVSRTRGNNDLVVSQLFYFVQRQPIIALDIQRERLALRCQYLPNILIEVIGERIVIIQDEDFHNYAQRTVRIAADFRCISSYSFSGSDSYTMPPLVCVYASVSEINIERNASAKVQSPLKPKCPTPPPYGPRAS